MDSLVLLHRPLRAVLCAFPPLSLTAFDVLALRRAHTVTIRGGAWVVLIELTAIETDIGAHSSIMERHTMRCSKQTMLAARSVSVLTAAFASTVVAFSPRTAGAQVPSDPCAPLTSAEVTAALGETVAAGQKATDKACAWTATKPVHQIVSLSFSPSGDWNKRKTQQLPGDTKVNLPGIGDEAFSETAGKYTSLYVKKGSTIFLVRVYGVPDLDQQLTIEKTIAKKVAGKV